MVIVPVLVVGLFFIAREAMPAFRAVFRKYDKLNESVEENVRAMRVVKGFAREELRDEEVHRRERQHPRATSRTPSAWSRSTPRSCSCACTSIWSFVLFVGSKLIITNGGTTIDVGQLSAMLTYGIQMLMSLMMVSIDLCDAHDVRRVRQAYLRGA